MLRTARYKLCIYGDDNGELFDMEADPLECCNLYTDPDYAAVRQTLTLRLLQRTLSVKVRDTGMVDWSGTDYPQDVRFEPLETSGYVTTDIRLQSGDEK